MDKTEHYDDSNSEDEEYDSESSYSEDSADEDEPLAQSSERKSDDENENDNSNHDSSSSESEEDCDEDNANNSSVIDDSDVWVKGDTFVPPTTNCTHPNSILKYGYLTKDSSPLAIFRHFMSDSLIEEIKDQTNLYADRLKTANANGMKKWTEASTNELWVFLGLEILMGLHKKPAYHDYWSKDKILRTPIFGESMSRDRFLLILRSLHFVDNLKPGVKSDRLNKLGTLLPSLMTFFKEFIEPGKFLSLDESLLLHKGRLSFKQYIPSKRARFGIKFFVLVDQETKFVIGMILYTGKGTQISADMITELGYGGACVATMSKNYWGCFRVVVIDNYFNSPVLADFLLTKKTYVLGTVRKNRKYAQDNWKVKKGRD